jgi:hypothetical protein
VSVSKRILFGNDPADDNARQRLAEETRAFLEPFKFKIPARRKNRLGLGPYWDPFWRSSLSSAAKELDIKIVHINDQVCTASQAEADAVRSRAEVIHQARLASASGSVRR